VGEVSSPLEALHSCGTLVSLCSLDRTSYFVPLDTKYIRLCREKSASVWDLGSLAIVATLELFSSS
jgi:hypothetical protein